MNYEDTMTVEGAEGYEAEDMASYYAAIQRQINDGQWSLQGSHGRTMMEAIREGRCLLGTKSATDYWGNIIPAREEVKEGTHGSRDLVVATMGEEWAVAMEVA